MKKIFIKYKTRFSISFSLLLIESVAGLLIPIVIGIAINDLIEDSYEGLIILTLLGLFTIGVDTLRRLIDSRSYAHMYRTLGSELSNTNLGLSTNQKSAQLTLLSEIVEFFENEMPDLFRYVFGLIGTLIIIFTQELSVAIASIIAATITFGIYFATANKTTRFNSEWNDEFEKRVDIIGENNLTTANNHLSRFTKWNVRLSDLETLDSSLAWLTAIALMVYTLTTITYTGADIGSVFAILIYVIEFIVCYIETPQYYNEWLRIKEISDRLEIDT